MMRSLAIASALILCAVFIGSFALQAHEDDPKILDRQPAYQGPGFRPGGANPTPLSVGFPSNGVQLLSWLPLSNFGSPSSGNDCWGYTAPSGREYAIFGHSSGTGFVEITDPTNPQVIANISGPSSLWRDIKTYQNYAYAVSEGGDGIQVFNLGSIDSGTVTLVSSGSGSTHNVAIDTDSGFLYRTGGGDNGLRIYSLANPANPTFVGSWNDRYVHDAQVVTYTSGPYAGRQIAFCAAGLNGGGTDTGLTVVDVTNKSAPFVRSQVSYPSRAYSHQVWIDEEKQFLYHGDELDEGSSVSTTTTRIFNISDLDNVTYVRSFTNGNAAVDHNMYVLGDKLFQANYRSGLRVWDISNRTVPVEMAFFDTYPSNDSASFNGLWSCYPYFPSGTVIGSDLERGLFMFRVGDPAIRLSLPDGTPDFIAPDGDEVLVQIEELDGTLDPGTAKLFYDSGSGFVEVDLAPMGGEMFTGSFASTPCGSAIEWYVTARGSDGITRTLPNGAPVTAGFQATSAAALATVFDDDVESNLGWSTGSGGDTATTGQWTRVDPVGTSAQPEDDHTANPARFCFVTGQGSVGGGVGENDVDGGITTLLSPNFDLSDASDAVISYWRWYSNDQGAAPNTDTFRIDVSSNGGSSWVRVETVGPAGPETAGGWIQHSFSVGDFVGLTSQVRMRFVAADEGDGSIVEAGIDDFRVSKIICADCNDNGVEDSEDISIGTSEDCNSNGKPDECDIADGTSTDANTNGIPDECETAILDCGEGQINAGCGSTSDILFVNGSSGGGDRALDVGVDTPLTFSIAEAPAQRGNGSQSKAIIYAWFTFPTEADVVNLPKQLGPMCFGPKLVETRPADIIWNSIGLVNKAGAHNAPSDPPMIADSTTLDFYDLPTGWGEALDITLQGFVPDGCSQGRVDFSVTNGILLRVR